MLAKIPQRSKKGGLQMPVKLIATLIVFVVLLIGGVSVVSIKTVHGNEVGVKETWGGVDPNPLPAATYTICRVTSSIYLYDKTSHVFVMNDTPPTAGETGKGRDYDAYLVQSMDQQDMHINLSVRWKYDQAKIVDIHKNYHSHTEASDPNIIEERLLRNTVQLIVKNHATKMKATEAYSGEGLVRLQTDIEKDLASPEGELRRQGILVENFVIEKIGLDPNYVAEIKARQIAQQKQQRAVEETKAADADALKAKAVAQADLNKAVVEAERDKQVAILKAEQEAKARLVAAEAQKQQTVLAAEAEAQRLKIASEAEKAAAENRASAVLAEGRAKAEAQKLMYAAYEGLGGQTFAQIEISRNMGSAFQNFNGFLPQNMSFTSLSGDFLGAVRNAMAPGKAVGTVPASTNTK
jgi:regulator of protease activity HflC (stomatin/prohibitin superfamily)